MTRKLKAARAAAVFAVPLAIGALPTATGLADERRAAAALVVLAPGAFAYRAPGDFSRAGKPANAPLRALRIERTLTIMQRQVTAAEYQTCVDAGACPRIPGSSPQPDRPAVGVSWRDADAYASWLSRETGARFRLPTDEEWSFAAGSRFKDSVLPDSAADGDPGRRALAMYDVAARSAEETIAEPQPIGAFGENEHGLIDLAGNVWEWTNTCFTRGAIAATGEVRTTLVDCGVRVVAGRHRTHVPDFIRDARAGGCGLGAPPTHLGFRLVRDDRWPGLRSLLGLRQPTTLP